MVRERIRIVEVGPRDGLQNEKRPWSLENRYEMIQCLSPCGFAEIEVGSFVSPKWIPQMAETDVLYSMIKPLMNQAPQTRFSVLVPNMVGVEQAIDSGVRDISIFTAASDQFCQKNINCTIDESFERFSSILSIAKSHDIEVRGYVSTVIECPYAGEVAPEAVASVAERLYLMGCREISLGDTIGKGTPETIRKMILAVKNRLPVEVLAIHCHDTFGTALDNIFAAMDEGVRTVDSAITGLGGCPYGGSGAKGNVATEKVVCELERKGYQTGIDLIALQDAVDFVSK